MFATGYFWFLPSLYQKTFRQDGEMELRMLVHTYHAGGIIGKSGQKIRDLREVRLFSLSLLFDYIGLF